MKRLAAVFIVSFVGLACGPYVDPQPVGPDLAKAPLGGEYVGVGQLQTDSCNGYDKNSEAGKEYFEPFVIEVKMYPDNEDHSSLNFNVGQVQLADVKPMRQTIDGSERYVFNHELVEEGGLHLSVLGLDGTVVDGEMRLYFSQKLYDGSKEDRGELVCEVLYNLHAKKVVNYPYVKP